MNTIQREFINECARILYLIEGCKVQKGYDFKKSVHPQEKKCYHQAVAILNYYKDLGYKDNDL